MKIFPGLFLFLFTFISVSYSQDLTIEQLQLKPPSLSNCTSIKDQNLSSTCWSFSSNSFIESEMMKKGKGNIDLSEMFIARYSYLHKILLHLQLKGKNFFTPGGQFHDVMWVVKNYGMMPESAYSGRGKGELYHNHWQLDSLAESFVNKLLNAGKEKPGDADLVYINDQFDQYLGKVPATFMYNSKEYTAKSFARDALEIDPDDYIEITSYTHHPFYKLFVLENKYNWTNDGYYNVSLNDFSRITDSALKNGYTVGWDGNAEDVNFDYRNGLAFVTGTITNFQEARQRTFDDQSTFLNHMMHIVGSSKDKYGYKWYYVKNSWGSSNELGGFLFMRDDYFKIRTVAIIVNKNAIPADIRKKLAL